MKYRAIALLVAAACAPSPAAERVAPGHVLYEVHNPTQCTIQVSLRASPAGTLLADFGTMPAGDTQRYSVLRAQLQNAYLTAGIPVDERARCGASSSSRRITVRRVAEGR